VRWIVVAIALGAAGIAVLSAALRQPAAFLAASERELYASLHDGTIKLSTDGRRTWTVRAAP
jgi:hypothetical protein